MCKLYIRSPWTILNTFRFLCYLAIFSFRHPTLPKYAFTGFDMLYYQVYGLNMFISQYKHLYVKTFSLREKLPKIYIIDKNVKK